MTHGKNSQRNARIGCAGRNRATAVTLLTETAIQLLNAQGNVKFIGEHSMHFAATLADVTIQIHPPFGVELKPSAQLKWLARILSDRKILPFGLDIWAPNKVLNAEWDLNDFVITSFRRGSWERILLSEAKKLQVTTQLFSHPEPIIRAVH